MTDVYAVGGVSPRIGVIGGGRMGAGIAHVFAAAGCPVTVVEASPEAQTTDLVGLDVRLNIAEHLATTLGPRFEPPALLREKVARGELGRKTGQGFYSWDS